MPEVPDVTWIRVRIEAPEDLFDASVRFWAAATGSAPQPDRDDRALLVPAEGSPFVAVTRASRLRWSVALELETDDPAELEQRAFEAGARRAGADGLRSPGDFRFDIVGGPSRQRPPPTALEGVRSRLDQVSVDCPPRIVDAEVEFWSALTGWDVSAGGLPEFRWLVGAEGIPIRLVFQELGDGHRGRRARAHLDLACGDGVDDLLSIHSDLGSTPGSRGRVWHTMTDPAGLSYCLTERDPDTGFIDRPL